MAFELSSSYQTLNGFNFQLNSKSIFKEGICTDPLFASLNSNSFFNSTYPYSLNTRSLNSSTFSTKENKNRKNLITRCSSSPNLGSNASSLANNSSENTRESQNYLTLSDFTRLYEPSRGRGGPELQTSVVTYTKPRPWWDIFHSEIQVDLVAAVHIADKEYFLSLQNELNQYDRVLYEMVVDMKKPKKKKNGSIERWRPQKQKSKSKRKSRLSVISFIQKSISQFLRLDFQLEHMDYGGSKWYHADLDLKTFKQLQKERGENFLSFAKDVTMASFKTLQSSEKYMNLDPFRKGLVWAARFVPMPLVGLFIIEGVCSPPNALFLRSPEAKALLDLDLVSALKVFLAKQLTADLIDGSSSLLESSVIIGERNLIAMNELEKAMAEDCKKIAIFYGSGHLPDLDRRLRDELGLLPVTVKWRTAWDLSGRSRQTSGRFSVALKQLAEVSGWPLNRYQTLALVLFSVVLAADLLVWELLLDSLKGYAEQFIVISMHMLDQGWGL